MKKSFGSGESYNQVLKGITTNIEQGQMCVIQGNSGSGKSTLIKILLKEVEPTSGRVVVNDMDLRKMPRRYVPKYRRRLGVVFQDFRLLNDRNVYENVAFAQRIVETPVSEIRRNVPAILATVGLAGKYKAKTKQLSGGEQQRVALARALVNNPSVLLADEPTGNLDSGSTKEIMSILKQLHREGRTVILITHDNDIAAQARRVIRIKDGKIEADFEQQVEDW